MVRNIHATKISRTIDSRVQGIFLGSREIKSESNVTIATIIANCIS